MIPQVPTMLNSNVEGSPFFSSDLSCGKKYKYGNKRDGRQLSAGLN